MMNAAASGQMRRTASLALVNILIILLGLLLMEFTGGFFVLLAATVVAVGVSVVRRQGLSIQ